ncbi:hypothetical protein J2X65_004642 [Ancylobacter sp. 3268]|uniref:DUF7674 family protein n=1 Tax=Ancylobacter sp. 3268 TaxID=2817752 RepID=UPI002860F54C|nr:hypothetical protein [Ancylobacter sp. 3268]MDR6955263.1 hypothetical protein [Ancylobacter sp. 3268]
MPSPLITRSVMFEPLLAADPSFRPRWNEFIAEWEEEGDFPLYLALHSLAEHILERHKDGDTVRFSDIFAVVECWHTEGDDYVKEAATIGFLESLQNLSGGNDRQIATIEPWLGLETRRWWDKLDRFWDGDVVALRDDG